MSTAVTTTDAPRSKTLDKYAAAIVAAKGRTNELLFDVAANLKSAHDELANNKSGTFGKWVEAKCGFTVQTANKYLKVLDAFGYLKPSFKYIDASALYFLSKDTTPEEAAEDAIKAAESGEHITLRRAKEFAAEYTVEAEEVTDPDAEEEVDEDDQWDDSPVDLAANWSPAACALDVRPVVAKWAKLCPPKDTMDLAQILRDLAEQVEKGVWNER